MLPFWLFLFVLLGVVFASKRLLTALASLAPVAPHHARHTHHRRRHA